MREFNLEKETFIEMLQNKQGLNYEEAKYQAETYYNYDKDEDNLEVEENVEDKDDLINKKIMGDFIKTDADFKKLYDASFKTTPYELTVDMYMGYIIPLSFYKLDKQYLDISHLQIGKHLYNLDDLYEGYKYYLKEVE